MEKKPKRRRKRQTPAEKEAGDLLREEFVEARKRVTLGQIIDKVEQIARGEDSPSDQT